MYVLRSAAIKCYEVWPIFNIFLAVLCNIFINPFSLSSLGNVYEVISLKVHQLSLNEIIFGQIEQWAKFSSSPHICCCVLVAARLLTWKLIDNQFEKLRRIMYFLTCGRVFCFQNIMSLISCCQHLFGVCLFGRFKSHGRSY